MVSGFFSVVDTAVVSAVELVVGAAVLSVRGLVFGTLVVRDWHYAWIYISARNL